MKKVMRLLMIASFLLVSAHFSFAQTEFIGRSEIELLWWGGVEWAWKHIFLLKDVQIQEGPMARLDVILSDNSPVMDENTDIYLHFDGCKKNDIATYSPYYTIREVDIFPSHDIKKFGACSAGFLNYKNSVRIKPLEGSIFVSDKPLESFTIDFYLYPTTDHDGTTVLSWYAPTVDTDAEFSGLRVFIKDGRLFWLFDNVFHDPHGNAIRILIGEMNRTPLNEWHHHALYYNADSGILTVYNDGKESNIVWVTDNGGEGGTLLRGNFSPYLAVPITLGEKFLGYIDEFRISRGKATFYLGNFRTSGLIMSDVMDLDYNGTKLVKIEWESIEDNGTAVRVYCRISSRYFLPYAERGEGPSVKRDFPEGKNPDRGFSELRRRWDVPGWTLVKNDVEFRELALSGRYFQWKAELFGTEGIYTPVLKSLTVHIEPDPPPAAPLFLEAWPLNGGVNLKWIKNRERDIAGYRIYYGVSSKYYFGRGSSLGSSPVFIPASVSGDDTESLKMMGLENEQVYFISITAVDSADQESGFSREFIVRPSIIYKGEE